MYMHTCVSDDHSRICLKIENSQGNSEYINASPIVSTYYKIPLPVFLTVHTAILFQYTLNNFVQFVCFSLRWITTLGTQLTLPRKVLCPQLFLTSGR